MAKNLLNRITNDEDVHHAALNTTVAWLAGTIANVISNTFFHYNLNQYNSTDHFAMGVGLGTLAYRKAGGGLKGIAAGVVAGTVFNATWETFENLYAWKAGDGWWKSMDTLSDIAAVYTGTALSFLTEKLKGYGNKYKIKKEEKWLL